MNNPYPPELHTLVELKYYPIGNSIREWLNNLPDEVIAFNPDNYEFPVTKGTFIMIQTFLIERNPNDAREQVLNDIKMALLEYEFKKTFT